MRVALFITEDWYAWSHRAALIRALAAEGHEVHLLTHVQSFQRNLEEVGAHVIPLNLDRSGRSLVGEAQTVIQLGRALRRLRPDILHNVALKPILYGTAVARATRIPVVINALAGMGSLYLTSETPRAELCRQALRRALAAALRSSSSNVVVQNDDDRELIESMGVQGSRVSVIRGAGVDLNTFVPTPEPPYPPIVVRYFGRLLWAKGLQELHDAAAILRDDPTIRVEAYGQRDPHNPRCVDEATLNSWAIENTLHVYEHTDDMAQAIADAHLIVLPSHREGLPKILLEAAASGRAMIATDVPGCREVVQHGRSGLLIPPHAPEALAAAIRTLAAAEPLRRGMGEAGRQYVAAELSDAFVNGQTLALYEELVQSPVRHSRPEA